MEKTSDVRSTRKASDQSKSSKESEGCWLRSSRSKNQLNWNIFLNDEELTRRKVEVTSTAFKYCRVKVSQSQSVLRRVFISISRELNLSSNDSDEACSRT